MPLSGFSPCSLQSFHCLSSITSSTYLSVRLARTLDVVIYLTIINHNNNNSDVNYNRNLLSLLSSVNSLLLIDRNMTQLKQGMSTIFGIALALLKVCCSLSLFYQ